MAIDATVSPSVRFDIIPYADLSPERSWRRLGSGSFGRVFSGEYLGLVVAIKEVLPSDEYDVDKYLARECKIMQEARHPNIVQYIGLCLAPLRDPATGEEVQMPGRLKGKPQQRILIISEYLPHGNLRSYLLAPSSTHPLPWRLRLSFATDVARALAYLHARRCIHRDLKPENLLVTENERIKVCDFGFARLQPRDADERRRASYCGTNTHMSPEVLMGLEFGLETDVFSLGVIFCELISRQLVDEDEVFQRQMPSFSIDPLEVSLRASEGCPPSFMVLALKCVSPNPSDRPSVRSILASLRQIEAEVVKREGGEHVGSVGFATGRGRATTKRGTKGKGLAKGGRPGMPMRIPSFGGEVKVPATNKVEGVSTSTIIVKHGDDEDGAPPAEAGGNASDEEEEAAIAFLDVRIDAAAGVGVSSVVSNASTLRAIALHGQEVGEGGAPYSLARGWSASGSTLPTLPSSWLLNAATPANGEGQAIADETEPEAHRDIFFDALTPSRFASTLSSITTFAFTSSDSDDSQAELIPPAPVPALHRFSLLKPGWNQLKVVHLNNATAAAAVGSASEVEVLKKEAKRRSAAGRQGKRMSGGLGGNGTGGVLSAALAKCGVCEKRLGLGKPFLACDDCGLRCHIKCSDVCAPDCTGDADLYAVGSGDSRPPGSKGSAKDDGKKLGKRPLPSSVPPPQPTRRPPPVPVAA